MAMENKNSQNVDDNKAVFPSSSSPSGQSKNNDAFSIKIPEVKLPKGGGALKNIDEHFEVNAANGTVSLSFPLPVSPARGNFMPGVSLNYNSGSGNGNCGLGWNVQLSSIQRETDKRLPLYQDEEDGDTYMFTGLEDLVPVLQQTSGGNWIPDETVSVHGEKIKRYRPRTEGSFHRIERITPPNGIGAYWKVTTPENIVTLFGRSAQSRVADPADPSRIFKWLPEFSFDDKGNCMQYGYVPEDLANVANQLHEQNRFNGNASFANTYLKRVQYGNSIPYFLDTSDPYNPAPAGDPGYLFEVVFDFGDHDADNPTPAVQNSWPARFDAFSNCRSAFEIRTYRLVQRILMFHYFKELGNGTDPAPCLVKSLNLSYRYFNNPAVTMHEKQNAETDYIISLQQVGYKRSGASYSKKNLPPLAFTYQELNWNTAVQDVSAGNAVNDPVGLGNNYQWLDLWNEGISGILTEQANGWFYKSNLGDGNFSPAAPIIPKPSFTGLGTGSLQLQDLEADGRKFIVDMQGPAKGYFELGENGDWQPFRSFEKLPNRNIGDPNTKFIDLNGDGKPELIVSEENVFTWYPNLGKMGFDSPEIAAKSYDEEKGAAVVFRDPEQCIFLADMSGDGMTDIVRIRNGEICYWANLGFGKFGAKVNMDNAPVFDNADLFNPSYLHLADVSGTGATDIIYLGKNRCRAWLNLSGNGWSEPVSIDPFPNTELPNQIAVLDFTGNGTASIVWSSPLPRYGDTALRYIDLMAGKKPYILSSYINNLGKEASWEYKSSTFFYLRDKAAGTPWITKLPFPVQCVSKTRVNDLASGLYLTCEYSYHHGYYDHPEKEFRGFGRVEKTDSEDFSHFVLSGASNVVEQDLHQSPVKTVTWFHTGAYIDQNQIFSQFDKEYHKGPFEFDLSPVSLPDGLSAIESRQALRACKGILLRQEVYALDESPLQGLPYSVEMHTGLIKMYQPKQHNPYAVFYVPETETATYFYERNLNDPRISQILSLQIDDFGNILQSASVVYGRKLTDASLPPDIQDQQAQLHILYTENAFTSPFDTATAYRLPLPAESKNFELTGIAAINGSHFTPDELLNDFNIAASIDYAATANNTTPQKRMVGDLRTIYLKNDLVTPLPLHESDELALVSARYRMVFTPSLITNLLGNIPVTDNILTDAKYVQLDGTNWWIMSGSDNYLRSAETVADAQKRFYTPVSVSDPYGSEILLSYDDYFLIMTGTEDSLQNKILVTAIDYAVLKPAQIHDVNDNTAEVIYDELGMVIANSLYGQENDGPHGDKPLSIYQVIQPANLAEVVSNPRKFLQQATSFYYYDLDEWMNNSQPACFAALMRETFVSDLEQAQTTRIFTHIEYCGGMGQTLQSKVQADPGPALQWTGGTLTTVDTTPDIRWIGTGRTIFNNKAKPVKQYEPFFSTGYGYESEQAIVEIGFSSIRYYDPAGRNIRTEHPNGTLSREEFDSWKQLSYDENDTVLESTWYAGLGSPDPASPEPADPEIRAAWLAAHHANTPAEAHLDSLGRTIFQLANNGVQGNYVTRSLFDILNNPLAVIDPRNNTVAQFNYDMTGRQVHQHEMDGGDRWLFPDTMNNMVYGLDSRNHRLRTEYDAIHRPTNQWLVADITQNTDELLTCLIVYGENQPDDTLYNLRGKPFQRFDQSGLVEISAYDIQGNAKMNFKQLAKDYKNIADWNVPDKNSLLDTETFTSSSKCNATNRPVEMILPDASKIMPAYNQTNLLRQINAFISGQQTVTSYVRNITYNAKSQRDKILYGNNTTTGYSYEDTTYRLIRLLTTRNNGTTVLQDLNYTFDPVANITQIIDNAQQTIFFNNAGVDPGNKFEYDAIYRLSQASGREHAGQNAASDQFDADKTRDGGGNRLVLKGDMQAMQKYQESYVYDAAGNMLQMVHNAGNGSFTNKWTRLFSYESDSNRLMNTHVGATTTNYQFDAHGNMLNLQNGNFNLTWNFSDQLQQIDLGGGGIAYYVYDNGGQRVRKVIENGNAKKERIYLGAFEVYREMQNDSLQLERETVHILDDKNRIALVETRTQGNDPGVAFLVRYQYGNHLNTACLELDAGAAIISYEEFYPFGSTAYQAMDNFTEMPKRYRYSGMERDEESGMQYHGARYYLQWLARWLNPDPIGINGGTHLFCYCGNNPVNRNDISGKQYEKSGNTETWSDPGYAGVSSIQRIQSGPGGVTQRIIYNYDSGDVYEVDMENHTRRYTTATGEKYSYDASTGVYTPYVPEAAADNEAKEPDTYDMLKKMGIVYEKDIRDLQIKLIGKNEYSIDTLNGKDETKSKVQIKIKLVELGLGKAKLEVELPGDIKGDVTIKGPGVSASAGLDVKGGKVDLSATVGVTLASVSGELGNEYVGATASADVGFKASIKGELGLEEISFKGKLVFFVGGEVGFEIHPKAIVTDTIDAVEKAPEKIEETLGNYETGIYNGFGVPHL
jgi:RHS repeat-associated protein